MVVRDESTGEYLGIRCDVKGCGQMSPPGDVILKGGGLNAMGWDCHGGSHLCPIHSQKIR